MNRCSYYWNIKLNNYLLIMNEYLFSYDIPRIGLNHKLINLLMDNDYQKIKQQKANGNN